ncbi:MAG: TonB family protein [Verrucomicrobia bacterium]|nr:TonB family protein [Verrucomicrobiota bacterium]
MKVLNAIAVLATVILPTTGSAQAPAYTFAEAISVSGKRYFASHYRGTTPPWVQDITNRIAPEYPDEERAAHHYGGGLYRVKLDPATGMVTSVSTLITAGYRGLDASAVAALRQWRWKPGIWKQIDLPITYSMGGSSPGKAANPFLHIPTSMVGGPRGRP